MPVFLNIALHNFLRNIQGLAEHPATTLEETVKLGNLHDRIRSLFIDKHRIDRGEISASTWRQYGYTVWSAFVVGRNMAGSGEPLFRAALRHFVGTAILS